MEAPPTKFKRLIDKLFFLRRLRCKGYCFCIPVVFPVFVFIMFMMLLEEEDYRHQMNPDPIKEPKSYITGHHRPAELPSKDNVDKWREYFRWIDSTQ